MTCEVHEEYQPGCGACFEEAAEAAVDWLTFEAMIGTRATRMPDPVWSDDRPRHLVFELSWGDDRLFAFVYREGDGLVFPSNAQSRIDDMIAADEALLSGAQGRRERAREEGDAQAEHRALRSEGELGARLDRMRTWVLT